MSKSTVITDTCFIHWSSLLTYTCISLYIVNQYMLQNMILALENNLLSGLSATNEKLDLLNKRVSCIEMRLSDGDPRKAPQENDSGLFKPQSAASGVRPRVRPCLRRQKAVCPEDGFDTSSSDESFSINLEGTVYTVANTQPHPNYFVLYYINLIITRQTTLKYKDVRLKKRNCIFFFCYFRPSRGVLQYLQRRFDSRT